MRVCPAAIASSEHTLEFWLGLLEDLVTVFLGCHVAFVEQEAGIALGRNSTPDTHRWRVLIDLSRWHILDGTGPDDVVLGVRRLGEQWKL